MSMAKITIDDIAKKVKVSKSTVSRYLNGGSEVFTCRFYGMEEAFLFEGKAEGTSTGKTTMNMILLHLVIVFSWPKKMATIR